MKRTLSTLTVGLLLVPSVTFAASLNATRVSAIISLLKAFGVNQETINTVQSDLYGNALAPAQSSAPKSNTDSTTSVTFSAYHSNPWQYEGQNISVVGMEDMVIPASNAGGASFVEIEDPFDSSRPEIELQIDNQADYTAAVDALTGNASDPIPEFVTAFGVGAGTQQFVVTGLLGKSTVSVPVISVSSLYQCAHGSMDTTVLTGTTIQDRFHCTQWTPIFPASAPPLSASTAVQSTPSPQSNTSDSQNSPAAPTCALTTSPASISNGQESKLSWISANATSGSISAIGTLSNLNSAMWVSPTATTTYTATFNGAGGSTQCSATVDFIPHTMTNGKLDQTITFNPLQDVKYGIVGFTIDAQASSGLGVNFTADGACTVTNDGTTIATGLGTASVYITETGACTVTAHQTGDSDYSAAPDISRTFTINPT